MRLRSLRLAKAKANSIPSMTPRVQIYYFSLWAESLLQASVYLEKLPSLDIKPLVADPTDKALLQLAQLDCDWDGENLRCYSQLSHPNSSLNRQRS